jgi:hypothetical protein
VQGPLFRARERCVDEGFLQVEFALLMQMRSDQTQRLFKRACPYPLLKAAVAGLE